MRGNNSVSVISFGKRFRDHEAPVKKRALFILKELGQKNVAVDIYLAGDALMHRLNRIFRGKNKVANILSFEEPPIPHPESKKKVLGEIYLNPGFVKDWIPARFHARPTVFTLDRFLAHGILHLLGFGHKTKNARIRMEKLEKRIMNSSS